VAVPGEHRDRVDLPAHPRQVGQAQVPQGMGGELRDAGVKPPCHQAGGRGVRGGGYGVTGWPVLSQMLPDQMLPFTPASTAASVPS
jgi:hypothetical protein